MASKKSSSKDRRKSALYPKPPFPEQHQPKPGHEHKLDPQPHFQAPRYRPANKLEGKVALITGGDSGIGRAVATLYAREGADVAIGFLSAEAEDAAITRQVVEATGRHCLLIPGDLGSKAFCLKMIDRVVKQFGRIDILVSNAAHQNRVPAIDKVSDQEFDDTFKTNVYAYFYLCRAAVKHMPAGSAIIATSSKTGLEGSEHLLAYSASKGAMNAFTKALAMELIDKRIRVNAVAPGPVWTPLNAADEGFSAKEVSTFGKDTLYKRPAQPEEIAPAYVFLASEADSSFITGIVLEQMGSTTAG